MPAKKKALPKTGRITDGRYPPTYFVLQSQEVKDGEWEDCEPGYDEWRDKNSAVKECNAANKESISDAKAQYERPQVGSGDFTTIYVGRGTDLDEAINEVKRAHKKFNPNPKKQVEKPPFDPESAYPKYRIVVRTRTDEVLEA